jgi:hypothetical protein
MRRTGRRWSIGNPKRSGSAPLRYDNRSPGLCEAVRDRQVRARAILAEFLRHLSVRNALAAAALWDVPALILGDEHVHGPLSRERLAASAGDAPLELLVERMTWTLAAVAAIDVR